MQISLSWLIQFQLIGSFLLSSFYFSIWAFKTNINPERKNFTNALKLPPVIFGLINLVFSLIILIKVNNFEEQNLKVFFGGFEKALAIEHNLTYLKSFFNLIICVIFLTYTIFTNLTNFNQVKNTNYIADYDDLFSMALVLSCLGSFFGIIFTNDIFNLYVFIEILSISLYTSAFLNKTKQSMESGFSYLIFGSLASCLIIFAIIIIYKITGQLNIDLIIFTLQKLSHQYNNQLTISFWLFTIALFIKMGIPPFYKWSIDFYSRGNLLFNAFSSALSSKVFLYIFACIVIPLFKNSHPIIVMQAGQILHFFLCCCILAFSLFCLLEDSLVKIVALSSISSICYGVLTGIGNHFFIQNGYSSQIIVLILGDAICKLILLGTFSIIISKNYGYKNLANFLDENNKKLNIIKILQGSSNAVISIVVLCIFTLASLPPSPMFFAKFDVMLSLLKYGYNADFFVLIIANALNIAFFVKICMQFLFKETQLDEQHDEQKSIYNNLNSNLDRRQMFGLNLVSIVLFLFYFLVSFFVFIYEF
jgi:formate hydrogenlyase subunit 3/multisubunit Na+/H+ antiporter MnhD subunit